MAKLYELTGAIRSLSDQLEEMDLDQQTIIDTIESSQELMNFEQKAAAVVRMMKNWESDTVAYDTEIKRLTSRKNATENNIKSMREYLQAQMEIAKIDSIKCNIAIINLQDNNPAVVIENEKLVPAKYLTIVPKQYVPDKKRIAEALKSGKMVRGCKLSVSKSLRIR